MTSRELPTQDISSWWMQWFYSRSKASFEVQRRRSSQCNPCWPNISLDNNVAWNKRHFPTCHIWTPHLCDCCSKHHHNNDNSRWCGEICPRLGRQYPTFNEGQSILRAGKFDIEVIDKRHALDKLPCGGYPIDTSLVNPPLPNFCRC